MDEKGKDGRDCWVAEDRGGSKLMLLVIKIIYDSPPIHSYQCSLIIFAPMISLSASSFPFSSQPSPPFIINRRTM